MLDWLFSVKEEDADEPSVDSADKEERVAARKLRVKRRYDSKKWRQQWIAGMEGVTHAVSSILEQTKEGS